MNAHLEKPSTATPNERMTAQVVKKVAGGFLARMDDSLAFVPNSFLDEELRENPDLLIERIFECEVFLSQDKYPPVVKPIGPFLSFEDWIQQIRDRNP
jgi:ribosomal protein S1